MINMNTEFGLSVLFDGFLAAIAAIGFAVISNPPKKAVFIAALLAAVGHACRYYLLHQTPLDLTSSTLIAAFTIGMGSMWFAKLIHCPAEVFSFPSLLPMIPGMYAYKIVFSLIMFMQNMKVPELQEKYLIDLFTNTIVTCSVIFMLAVGATIPLFLFIKRAFSMTRHEKN